MQPTVECCLRNVAGECRTTAERLGIDLSVAPCRERCDACREGPFLLVDGELRRGDGFRELLEAVDSERGGKP